MNDKFTVYFTGKNYKLHFVIEIFLSDAAKGTI